MAGAISIIVERQTVARRNNVYCQISAPNCHSPWQMRLSVKVDG